MTTVSDKHVGQTLRELRGGISQEQLAGAMRSRGHLKWSQSTVWSVETGGRPLRLIEAADLAEILECSVGDLLKPESATPERRFMRVAADTEAAFYALVDALRTFVHLRSDVDEALQDLPEGDYSEEVAMRVHRITPLTTHEALRRGDVAEVE